MTFGVSRKTEEGATEINLLSIEMEIKSGEGVRNNWLLRDDNLINDYEVLNKSPSLS